MSSVNRTPNNAQLIQQLLKQAQRDQLPAARRWNGRTDSFQRGPGRARNPYGGRCLGFIDNRQNGPLLVRRGDKGGTVIEGTGGSDKIDVQRDPSNLSRVIVRCGDQTIVLGAEELPVEIRAGAGDDTVTVDASLSSVKVCGEDGDDTLQARAGRWGARGKQDFDGGDGKDTLKGGDGADKLKGGKGDDVIMGMGGDDRVEGGKGYDRIFGGRGDDHILGGKGCDTIDGGDGDDHIEGQDGRDTIYGRAGNDYIHGGNANDHIYGGKGDDTLDGGRHRDTIEGGAGNDLLRGGHGRDILRGGSGNDRLQGGQGKDDVYGGSGYDTATGERGKVDLGNQRYEFSPAKFKRLLDSAGWLCRPQQPQPWRPRSGHSLPCPNGVGDIDVSGRSVNVRALPPFVNPSFTLPDGTKLQAFGGAFMTYKDGQTVITAGDGDDSIKVMRDHSPANPGGLLVYCNGAWASLNAEEAKNLTINARDGDDMVVLGDGVSGVTVNGGAGDDALVSEQRNWLAPWLQVRGNQLNGGAGDDLLVGGDGQDRLSGGSGHNFVFGRGGDDSIDSSQGQDYVDGGAGRDFVWARDTLFGWLAGQDLIQADRGDVVVQDQGDVVRRRPMFLR